MCFWLRLCRWAFFFGLALGCIWFAILTACLWLLFFTVRREEDEEEEEEEEEDDGDEEGELSMTGKKYARGAKRLISRYKVSGAGHSVHC